MAKGLGSGMPISAIASRADLMVKWKAGTHGGTYGGGNALATAAACATLAVIQEEGLVQNAAEMGEYLQMDCESCRRNIQSLAMCVDKG